MSTYNQPDSDINEEEITLCVRCAECQETHTMVICMESMEDYTDNGDGTHTDFRAPFCSSCMEV